MSRFFIVFLLFAVAMLSSCKKDDEARLIPDPDEFNSDASAMLNGEPWYAYMNWKKDYYIDRDTNSFSFVVSKNGILREDLGFDWIPLKVGTYSIREHPEFLIHRGNYASYGTWLSDGDLVGEIYHSSSDTAFHFFALDKYDLVKQEVEGRFQVELIKDPSRDFFDTPDTLRFTNGRFKLRVR
ncbi:MAG: hypothetical protein IAE84_11345 [Saprospiraceae bacterium]|nr:hypothetical protein [Saprospiraceae bacterium]HRD79111.1 hypothetical protein [Saprospiraceae bacterium]